MLFNEIAGQEAIKNRLIQSVQEQRISHALLFAGPEGCGKLALALAYAQYISCRNRQNQDSCGVCPECRKYQKLIHPDLHFAFPLFKSDDLCDRYLTEWRNFVNENPFFNLNQWLAHIEAGNAQGMIYAKESDQIIQKLSLKTFESEYKIMIIWMPEKMHPTAANKLLKILEEPPAKTLFLLVSENEDQLITTIRSRTQLIKIPPFEDKAILQMLSKRSDIAGKDLKTIVKLSRGNYVRALSLLNPSEDTLYNLDKFMSIMRLTYSKKVLSLIDWVNELAGIGRERQKAFLLYSLTQIRENFISNAKIPNINYMTPEEYQFSTKFAPFINGKNVIPIGEEFEKAYLHISMNGNPRLVFLDMALTISKLIR